MDSRYHYTRDDKMQPVYCVGCRAHIPREISSMNRGLCPDCIAKLNHVTPPPVQAVPPPVHYAGQGNAQQSPSPPPSPLLDFKNVPDLTPTQNLIITGIAGLICVLILWLVIIPAINRPSSVQTQNPEPVPTVEVPNSAAAAPMPARENDSEYRARFAAVANIFIEMGARVDPFDPSHPYTMRAYLPNSVALDITDRQAREIAGMARERLHDRAIVYIKTEAGQTIGKATPWGFE